MTRKEDAATDKIKCLKCEKLLVKEGNFYININELINIDRFPVCKKCLNLFIGDKESYGYLDRVLFVLRTLDRPFLYDTWINDSEENWAKYIRQISSLHQHKGLKFKDSVFKNKDKSSEHFSSQPTEEIDNNKNTEDVIRILGYDPFESEQEADKKYLYNKLVDFLDESTLEDSFKLPAVIEIVKTFNQIDKINSALSIITTDINSVSKNVGGIKSLIDAKEKMLKSVLALAKDNGISVNHNNNKSKGAGTLTGIIKTLQEKGFEEAEVNLFDVETCEGIRQVADISNESIMKQLQFDENDYTEMLIEQREIIQELDSKTIKLEEENRLLKKELIKYQAIQGGDIDG